ncbi:MAG TPA: methyltransferase domain-containing protein [Chloroflexota bacterium]|nr:methyltransferase domain-containing protein [Chloroflexota bacterium]
MPTTRPRKLRLGGLELSVTLERTLAERLRGSVPYRLLHGSPPTYPVRSGEPVLNGTKLSDIEWYHTIELSNGIVTPGFVDHRDQVQLYGLPDSLAGKRCLDVATFDGFWAFEMEKRGAAEVVGIDVYSLSDCDCPLNWRDEYLGARANDVKGFGFAYAKRALNSKVQRKVMSVYELSPETIGTFDYVFMSDLLLHLREPLRALEALWTVTKGDLIIADTYDAELESSGATNSMRFLLGLDDYSGCFWWSFTSTVLDVMLRVARFQDVQKIAQFDMKTRKGVDVPKIVFKARGGG